MAHKVKCCYCNKMFDRDTTQYQQVGRRYAHLMCYVDHEAHKSQDEIDKEALEEYVMKLFNEDFVNPRIVKQIRTYVDTYHYSYANIKKSLIYAFEIKKIDLNKANGGIGIVPYIYKEAMVYYDRLLKAKTINDDKNLEDYKIKQVQVRISTPEREPMRKRQLFTFLDKEDVDG